MRLQHWCENSFRHYNSEASPLIRFQLLFDAQRFSVVLLCLKAFCVGIWARNKAEQRIMIEQFNTGYSLPSSRTPAHTINTMIALQLFLQPKMLKPKEVGRVRKNPNNWISNERTNPTTVLKSSILLSKAARRKGFSEALDFPNRNLFNTEMRGGGERGLLDSSIWLASRHRYTSPPQKADEKRQAKYQFPFLSHRKRYRAWIFNILTLSKALWWKDSIFGRFSSEMLNF